MRGTEEGMVAAAKTVRNPLCMNGQMRVKRTLGRETRGEGTEAVMLAAAEVLVGGSGQG
jgi:hypothetical protein